MSTKAPKKRDLIIPHEVLALSSDVITWSARLVLAEIINLYKWKRNVFARDVHFEKLLKIKPRTVSDSIKQLADAGLIIRVVNNAAPENRRRRITPTVPGMEFPEPLADSASGLDDEDEDQEEVEALADSASGEDHQTVVPLAKSASAVVDHSQNLLSPLADSATNHSQILPSPLADSAIINNSLNTKGNNKGNNKGNPIPTAASPTADSESACKSTLKDEQKAKADARFTKWQAWAHKNAPRVLKMKNPLTAEQLDSLVSKWGVKMLEDVFESMDNYGPLTTKNFNTWKTADVWCRRRADNPTPQKGKINQPITPTRTSDSLAQKIHGQQTKVIE